ncbi:sigma-70 family RNA polymerase sigma factor [Staphylococcus succinus]|uniref:sigma-70 family RNA polymerase sigma factor n=1 Tax=Staphylococcus succinus TaxID=61015 RepID=UPI000D1FD72E|nr:sigma-70 family RNA polymerase sigma factor [Staphylococcus succinus]PTI48851.1 sigma-70 family RNA polymerase sigma factor [Staphylococcus succinus]PTJ85320.1 sigma-70 family RNA polymerase sigma factor [Staphylococcus succinus]
MFESLHNNELTSQTPCDFKNTQVTLKMIEPVLPMIKQRLNHFTIHPNDKEDLCQEVLLKLLRILSAFDFTKSTPFEHYVNRIITTVKNDYLRKKVYTQQRHELLVNEFKVKYQYATTMYLTEQQMIADEISNDLYHVLEKLTELEQSVMVYILKEYKPQEIAKILNVKIKVVYNTIQRCKMKIRRYLK